MGWWVLVWTGLKNFLFLSPLATGRVQNYCSADFFFFYNLQMLKNWNCSANCIVCLSNSAMGTRQQLLHTATSTVLSPLSLTLQLYSAHMIIKHHTPSDPQLKRFWKLWNVIWNLLGVCSFGFDAPSVWNSLPASLQNLHILSKFKTCQSAKSPHSVQVQNLPVCKISPFCPSSKPASLQNLPTLSEFKTCQSAKSPHSARVQNLPVCKISPFCPSSKPASLQNLSTLPESKTCQSAKSPYSVQVQNLPVCKISLFCFSSKPASLQNLPTLSKFKTCQSAKSPHSEFKTCQSAKSPHSEFKTCQSAKSPHCVRVQNLPVCKISPLCPSWKPSSRPPSLDRPFHNET